MERNGVNTVILSFNSTKTAQAIDIVSQRAIDALAAFGTPRLSRIRLNSHTLVLTACVPSQIAFSGGQMVILHGTAALTTSGRSMAAADIAPLVLRSGAASADAFEPPFLMFFGDASGARAISDATGIVHLFWWRDGACAALATSAALLARIFAAPLSFEGVYQSMTVGHRLGEATAFSGIRMAAAGVAASLVEGRIDLRYPEAAASTRLTETMDTGKRAISAAVARCLSADPDCGIELSGGMDSRMALAAMPFDLRKGRKAYTIGYPGSRDIEIAKGLAARFAMQHVVVDLSRFDAESPDVTWQRARRVAFRDDFSTNVIDRLAIDCVDDSLLGCARIGGVNGELARGFYYPLLPVTGPVTDRSADALIRYRLAVNDAAPRELFRLADRQTADADLHLTVASHLREHPQSLGLALDWFYLRQRMRHWAGAGISRATMSRMILAPFFHRDYIGWAMGLPVLAKKDSVGFCSVMSSLDPDLAAMPLDSMLTPAGMATGGIAARLALLRVKARKLGHKIGQKLGALAMDTVGSQQFLIKLADPELFGRIDWNGLSASGLFSDQGLEQFRAGDLARSRAGLGHILSLHFLNEYLNAPVTPGSVVTDLPLFHPASFALVPPSGTLARRD